MKYEANGSRFITVRSVSFQGAVVFNYEAYSPELGKLKMNGEYLRIKPKYERPDLTAEEMRSVSCRIMEWVQQFFNTYKEPDYYKKLVISSICLGAYIEPWADLQSKEMELGIKSLFFDWITDDLLEKAVLLKLPYEEIDHVTQDLLEILTYGQKSNIFKSQSTHFGELYSCLHDLRNLFLEVIPEYDNYMPLLRYYMKRYFDCCKFYAIYPKDEMVSEAMFGYWRHICVYYDKTAAVLGLIHGILPSSETLTHPVFARIMDIMNSSGSLMNDIVGIKKDIEQDDPNFVLFKTKVRGIPFETAVNEVCLGIEEELKEYLKLREVILNMYPGDLKMERFIHLLDTVMDGQNRMYIGTQRYGTNQSLELTR